MLLLNNTGFGAFVSVSVVALLLIYAIEVLCSDSGEINLNYLSYLNVTKIEFKSF